MNEVTINKMGVTEVYYSGHPIDGSAMMVESLNVAIVVFIENIHGAMWVLDMGAIPKDRVDLEVDKWVKNIGKGMVNPYQYRFIKKVDNVYFYK